MQTQAQFEVATELGTIRGECHEPSVNSIYATVQIVHGYFSSHRVGPNRLYVELARLLCEAGFIVIRADALGVGESDGDFEQTSFGSELRDALTVHQFISARYSTFQHIVIGHSLGANVALRMTSESKNISMVVPISPVLMGHGGISNLFSAAQMSELMQSGQTVRKGLLVRRELFNDWQMNDAVTLAKSVRVPIRVFQGKADQFYAPCGAQELIEGEIDGKCCLIAEADHNFLNTSGRKDLYRIIKDELVSHFSRPNPP